MAHDNVKVMMCYFYICSCNSSGHSGRTGIEYHATMLSDVDYCALFMSINRRRKDLVADIT